MSYRETSEEEVYSVVKKIDSVLGTWNETIPKKIDSSTLYDAYRNFQTDTGRNMLQQLKELIKEYNSMPNSLERTSDSQLTYEGRVVKNKVVLRDDE